MTPDEFDQAFDRYLKERFKPFRDKERPADYGARSRRRTPSARRSRRRCRSRPSPSGDLLAVVTVNRKDGELDIVLISAKDGSVVRNLTDGLRQGLWASTTSCSSVSASTRCTWMSWSPKGDRLAYFVRTEKERTLIVQNVLTRNDRGRACR